MHGLGAEDGVGALTCETDTILGCLAVSSILDFMPATKGLVASKGLLLTMSNVSIMIITTFTMVETVFSDNIFCSIKMWFDGLLINHKIYIYIYIYRMCIFNVCLVNEQMA